LIAYEGQFERSPIRQVPAETVIAVSPGMDFDGRYLTGEYIKLIVRRRRTRNAKQLLGQQQGTSVQIGPFMEFSSFERSDPALHDSLQSGYVWLTVAKEDVT
jgi:hypothetical protein